MHSLFTKIFLCFWLTMMVAGAVLMVSETGRVQKTKETWRRMTADAFGVYATSAAEALADEPAGEARAYLADLEKRTGIRAWLFDERGREVTGYAPHKSAARGIRFSRQIQSLVARARGSRKTEFEALSTGTMAARLATPVKGRSYVLAGELPEARFGLRGASPHIQALRLFSILLTSGLVCWGLGRYLTRPIVTLRTATQRLAGGDLTVRAGAALGRRRDELADLSRDFDGMASRIEKLLASQERLVRAQRRLLGDVSHELRSPLARATVALALARDHLKSGDKLALTDTLDRIEHETERQGELIDRLLTMARLESGLLERGSARIDLGDLLSAVVVDADYEARALDRSVRITHCDECVTTGTAELLRSALENVVRNAVRHTADHTGVEISQSREIDGTGSPLAVICVADHGSGVPEAQLTEIFRPFYRAEVARDRARGGAGLGLSITARAVELHGGQITASNAPPGGLAVEIRLPVEPG